ncbi:NTPase [Candidatus Bathyarchaeota archaeon]|nr:NTPase [Candidatus Bathyarchaeota archaeon]
MKKRILLLTGSPGVGKTSVLRKVVASLKAEGYSVGGMISHEVRSHDTRIGFEILDINNNRRGWLAHVNQKAGPQVGRYRVNMEDLEGLGVSAIAEATEKYDIVAIDEIGPMELFSKNFRETVTKAVDSRKLVVGIIHWKARNKLVDDVKKRGDVKLYVVTYENRDDLHRVIVKEAIEFLRHVF